MTQTRADTYTPDSGRVDVLSRDEFFADVWRYNDGAHVTFLGPTRRGKSYLCTQCLQHSISPDRKATVLAGKPKHRDPTMKAMADKLNLRVIEEWPPDQQWGDKKRNGYVLQPHQSLTDLDSDNANLSRHFKGAVRGNFAAKNKKTITVADEAFQLQNDLGAKKEYEATLMRGAPDAAMWSLLQRGRFSSYLAYDAPEHIFIFDDPDMSNQRRYSEIGGVDPKFLIQLSRTLKTYEVSSGDETNTISECIYIRRSGPYVCIVDVN